MKNYIFAFFFLMIYAVFSGCSTKNNTDNTKLENVPDTINNNTEKPFQETPNTDSITINPDTLTFTNFKRLVELRITVINPDYINKFTSLKIDSIGGYRIHELEEYDLLILRKAFLKDGKFVYLLYDKWGNETDKLVVQTSSKVVDDISTFSDVNMSKIFSERTLIVEYFDSTNEIKPFYMPEDKKNLKEEYYIIKDGKWVKL